MVKNMNGLEDLKNIDGFSYKPCEQTRYQMLIEEAGSGFFTEEISLKKLNSVLSKIRKNIFKDFTNRILPRRIFFWFQ